MTYSFSSCHAEKISTRQGPAFGLDQEAVHRIRHLGRIERAKIVRQAFATLKRFATALRFGGSLS